MAVKSHEKQLLCPSFIYIHLIADIIFFSLGVTSLHFFQKRGNRWSILEETGYFSWLQRQLQRQKITNYKIKKTDSCRFITGSAQFSRSSFSFQIRCLMFLSLSEKRLNALFYLWKSNLFLSFYCLLINTITFQLGYKTEIVRFGEISFNQSADWCIKSDAKQQSKAFAHKINIFWSINNYCISEQILESPEVRLCLHSLNLKPRIQIKRRK